VHLFWTARKRRGNLGPAAIARRISAHRNSHRFGKLTPEFPLDDPRASPGDGARVLL
jgi:hypothetical protein